MADIACWIAGGASSTDKIIGFSLGLLSESVVVVILDEGSKGVIDDMTRIEVVARLSYGTKPADSFDTV